MKLDINKENERIGLVSSRGGVVNNIGVPLAADAYFYANGETNSEMCTFVHIANGGNIILIGEDGVVNPFLAVLDGSVLVVKAKGVAYQASIKDSTGNTVMYTTTCTGITWHGGQ